MNLYCHRLFNNEFGKFSETSLTSQKPTVDPEALVDRAQVFGKKVDKSTLAFDDVQETTSGTPDAG